MFFPYTVLEKNKSLLLGFQKYDLVYIKISLLQLYAFPNCVLISTNPFNRKKKKSYKFFVLLHVPRLEQFQQPFLQSALTLISFDILTALFLERLITSYSLTQKCYLAMFLYIHIPDFLKSSWCYLYCFEHSSNQIGKNQHSSDHINASYITMISIFSKNWEQNMCINLDKHLSAVKSRLIYESNAHVCVCTNLYLFPIATITNYHKLINLKQHKLISFQMCGSNTVSLKAKIKV